MQPGASVLQQQRRGRGTEYRHGRWRELLHAYLFPSQHADDDRCHNISVKLNKEKYQISYRRNYCRVSLVSTAADENANHSGASALEVPLEAGDVLQANMKPGAPMLHDLVFSAHVRTGGVGLATPAQMEQLQEQAAFFLTQRKNKALKPLPPVKVQMYAIDYRVFDPEFKAQAARSGQQPDARVCSRRHSTRMAKY